MKSGASSVSDNLWDSVADLEVGEQQDKDHPRGVGVWGLGAAFTKLRIVSNASTTTSSNSTHGGAEISNTPPTSKSPQGNDDSLGKSQQKEPEQPRRRSSLNGQAINGVAGALWRLGGRDDGINENDEVDNKDNANGGSFWNNLKKNHSSDTENESNIKDGKDADESDYDTDMELDSWQKHTSSSRGRRSLGPDDDLETEPDLLLPTKKIPKQEIVQVPRAQNSSYEMDGDHEDQSTEADSEIDPGDANQDESEKLGLGAFLTLGKEAALEEKLMAYMNPDPDDKSIADLSLISSSLAPAEQKRLLQQRMDMSLGKSVNTSLNPTEAATKELRPWRHEKHLHRGSALGAMPPGTVSMLAALSKDDSDGSVSENDSLLFTIPAEFQKSLDRHIPKGNFDEMWKDGAATVCTMDVKTSDDASYDFDHQLIAEKVKGKLDAEDRTSLFPDADDEVYSVAQQKLIDEIKSLSAEHQQHCDTLLSPSSSRRSERGTRKKSSSRSEVAQTSNLKNSGRKPEERRSSRSSSAQSAPADKQTERLRRKAERSPRTKSSTPLESEDHEELLNDIKEARGIRRKSSRPTSRRPEDSDVAEARSRKSSRPTREHDSLETGANKKPGSRRSTKSREYDVDQAEFDENQIMDEKERTRRKSSRRQGESKETGRSHDQVVKERRGRRSAEGSSEKRHSERLEHGRVTKSSHESERETKGERGRRHLPSNDHESRDEQKRSTSQPSNGGSHNDLKQGLKSELKPWRTPKKEELSRSSHDDPTDRHENTALAALEGRSRASTAQPSIKPRTSGTKKDFLSVAAQNRGNEETRSSGTGVSTKSDISKPSSTGSGTTAETFISIGNEDVDVVENLAKPKKRGFFSSLGLKKANHSKLEDDEEASDGLVENRATRRRSLGAFSEGKASNAPRRLSAGDKLNILATTRRKPENQSTALLTAGLLSMEQTSSDGWGSIDDDIDDSTDFRKSRKETRRRSTSVPRSSANDIKKSQERSRSTSKTCSDGEAETRRKKRSSTFRNGDVEDQDLSARPRSRKSSSRPSRSSTEVDTPQVRSTRHSSRYGGDLEAPNVSTSKRSSRAGGDDSSRTNSSRQSAKSSGENHARRRVTSAPGDDVPRAKRSSVEDSSGRNKRSPRDGTAPREGDPVRRKRSTKS